MKVPSLAYDSESAPLVCASSPEPEAPIINDSGVEIYDDEYTITGQRNGGVGRKSTHELPVPRRINYIMVVALERDK